MKINIEQKNNKFYLEVERPTYTITFNQGREVDKIYRKIERNIEKYKNEEKGYNVQYNF